MTVVFWVLTFWDVLGIFSRPMALTWRSISQGTWSQADRWSGRAVLSRKKRCRSFQQDGPCAGMTTPSATIIGQRLGQRVRNFGDLVVVLTKPLIANWQCYTYMSSQVKDKSKTQWQHPAETVSKKATKPETKPAETKPAESKQAASTVPEKSTAPVSEKRSLDHESKPLPSLWVTKQERWNFQWAILYWLKFDTARLVEIWQPIWFTEFSIVQTQTFRVAHEILFFFSCCLYSIQQIQGVFLWVNLGISHC